MGRINQYIRQTGLIDPVKLEMPITIIGAGGIGSWTALALIKMGCVNVTSIDMDSVEEHNLGSQFYTTIDVDKKKTQALADKIEQMTDWHLTPVMEEWTPEKPLEGNIIISAVDDIDLRKQMFESLKGSDKIFIDGRMAGNYLELYVIPMYNPERVAYYETTLFSSDEADPTPCTERAVIYNCLFIGALMADVVAQIANGSMPPYEITFDLKNFMLDTQEDK